MKYIFLLISLLLLIFAGASNRCRKRCCRRTYSGADVFWMNTTNGVTTNEDGNFSIHKPARSHMLVVSFIGFENDTIHVDKRETNNLILFFVKEWN